MKPLEDDIKYIDDTVERLKKYNSNISYDMFNTIARLLETKALLVSVQQDAELSLEDLQNDEKI